MKLKAKRLVTRHLSVIAVAALLIVATPLPADADDLGEATSNTEGQELPPAPADTPGESVGEAPTDSAEDADTSPPAENGQPVPEDVGAADSIADENSENLSDEGRPESSLSPMTFALPSVMATGNWAERRNQRLSGADRYATAVAVSKHTFPSTSDTVILATGADFPDSLSAAALAAKLKAPLLLTSAGVLPSSTSAEISRLKPKRIVIAGGTGAVSAQVANSLKASGRTIVRLGGADRYATSAAISRYGWGTSSEAFIATGLDYADALAAAAAAGTLDAPVLLVPGKQAKAPKSVTDELSRLKVQKIRIAGGTGSVSSAMQSSLSSSRSIVRYAGSDRFETSALIARGVFSQAADTYWANGLGFPDALTGAAAAGVRGGAMLLVRPDCVPSAVYSANDFLAPPSTLILGGTGVLSNGVLHGNECMARPGGMSNSDWTGAQRLYTSLNQQRYAQQLSAFRVSNSYRGAPAQTWAKQIGSGTARQQSGLSIAQPWVRYQTAVVTNVSGGSAKRADRMLSLMLGNNDGSRWLRQANGGARGYVSVGYFTAGAKSSGVIFVGAGLNR